MNTEQPTLLEPIHMEYASPRRITSQADDNLVPICGRARSDLYGSKRSVVLHAWTGSTSAEAKCAASPQPLARLIARSFRLRELIFSPLVILPKM
jgi:hypothetical protein